MPNVQVQHPISKYSIQTQCLISQYSIPYLRMDIVLNERFAILQNLSRQKNNRCSPITHLGRGGEGGTVSLLNGSQEMHTLSHTLTLPQSETVSFLHLPPPVPPHPTHWHPTLTGRSPWRQRRETEIDTTHSRRINEVREEKVRGVGVNEGVRGVMGE